MKTKSWSPPPVANAPKEPLFSTLTLFQVIDNKGNMLELSYFSTLYAALASVRARLPCSVLFGSAEIFSFDGTRAQGAPEFMQAVPNFEFYLLLERKAGYTECLDWIQGNPLFPPSPDTGSAATSNNALPAVNGGAS